jgi:hypothetical protein
VSHIGTPEWQSFELRMQQRARVRRALRRRRRVRRASGAGVLLVLLAAATGAYVDVMIEPGPDVSDPSRPFSPRYLAVPSLPAPMLTPVSIDPPAAVDDPFTSVADVTADLIDAAAAEPEPKPAPTVEDNTPARAVTAEAENRSDAPAALTRRSIPQSRTAAAETTGTTGNGDVPPAPARSPAPSASPPLSQRPAAVEPESQRAPATLLPERAPELPAPAPAASSPPAAPPPAITPAIDHSASVRSTIERYRRAYEELDASAAREVWPAVEQAALERAFGSLSSQRISFENCSIDVIGRLATASCRGTARVVPRVGGGTQTARRSWVFWLRQSGDGWVIDRTQIR